MISSSRYDAGAIVVTGASRGIGRCVAKDLVGEGSTVVAIARDAGNLEGLRSEVTGMPGRLLIHRGDVCDSEWFESVLSEVEKAEPIRGLVANAGVNPIMKTAVNTTAEMFDHIMGVNVRATFMCCTAVIRRMRGGGCGGASSGGGTIVLVGSMGSDVPIPGNAVYCMSKAATVQLARVLALETAADGIRVNVVSPGFLATDLTASIRASPSKIESLEQATPLGRIGTVDDVSAAVRFLLSRDASYATGTVLTLDGGFTLSRGWPPTRRPANDD